MPVDPDVSKALNAETIEEFWEGFKKKPLKFIANVGLESLPQMLPGIAAAIPAGLIAGPPGAAVAIGAGSGVVDYAASTMEALARRKVDLTDESAIRRAVADPAMLEEVKIAAFKHAAPGAKPSARSRRRRAISRAKSSRRLRANSPKHLSRRRRPERSRPSSPQRRRAAPKSLRRNSIRPSPQPT